MYTTFDVKRGADTTFAVTDYILRLISDSYDTAKRQKGICKSNWNDTHKMLHLISMLKSYKYEYQGSTIFSGTSTFWTSDNCESRLTSDCQLAVIASMTEQLLLRVHLVSLVTEGKE